jgi:hypothetical protein
MMGSLHDMFSPLEIATRQRQLAHDRATPRAPYQVLSVSGEIYSTHTHLATAQRAALKLANKQARPVTVRVNNGRGIPWNVPPVMPTRVAAKVK